MHAIALGAVRSVSRTLPRLPCRTIGGARCSPSRTRRSFQTTRIVRSQPLPDDNSNENSKEEVKSREEDEGQKDGRKKLAKNGSGGGRISTGGRARPGRQRQQNGLPPVVLPRDYWNRCVLCLEEERTHGKLLRKPVHGRSSKDLKHILQQKTDTLDWARDLIAQLDRDADLAHTVRSEVQGSPEQHLRDPKDGVTNHDGPAVLGSTKQSLSEMSSSSRYTVDQDVYTEALYLLQAALALRPPETSASQTTSRPVTVLQCPQDGAHEMLSSIIETVAQETKSDLIRLDANDFAECLGAYVGENIAWRKSKIASLGYDTAKSGGRSEGGPVNGIAIFQIPQEDPASMEEDEELPGAAQPPQTISAKDLTRRIGPVLERVDKLMGWKPASTEADDQTLNFSFGGSPWKSGAGSNSGNSSDLDNWTSLKITATLERLIESAEEKASKISQSSSSMHTSPRNIIIHVQDFKELCGTTIGADLVSRLRNVVDKKWRDGSNIVCVGTTANRQVIANGLSGRHIRQLETDTDFETRNIYVPPDLDTNAKAGYEDSAFTRTRDINIRQIENMTRAMVENSQHKIVVRISEDINESRRADNDSHGVVLKQIEEDRVKLDVLSSELHNEERIDRTLSKKQQDIDAVLEKYAQPKKNFPDLGKTLSYKAAEDILIFTGIGESVWALPRVRRIVTLMLGSALRSNATQVGARELHQALVRTERSEDAKLVYLTESLSAIHGTKILNEDARGQNPFTRGPERILELTATCTTHEKKMLKGVVSPTDIKTTFKDIRAPDDTIEALKTLTGLSLLRPEAFSYGVLASDKIPGLLLYGPPGTGKTLLAKAVAKESGATVLEVSGADINDMYVGEGEKNVKAVFSLAKKLSPCIVFIDEADAIFGARSNGGKQRSHREMINQFLREWDGMQDMGTFIMIATNRPFDLDDAVLRRLPRRLLVDLPVEKDREAILQIHLKDEVLETDVSLSQIAKDTPFYSGSDLKNVCVAAALACIREENAEAAKWTGEGKYQYPEKRTLKGSHFKKALEEISASISEDMSTLAQIRKFDERYGDRKGRRKKRPQMGFGIGKELENDSDAVRVRNVDL